MGLGNFLSSILLPKQLVITFNGKTYQILRTAPGFAEFHAATKEKSLSKIEQLLHQYGYIKDAVIAVAAQIKEIAKQRGDLEEEQVSGGEPDDDDCEDEISEEPVEAEAVLKPLPTQNLPEGRQAAPVGRQSKPERTAKTKTFKTLDVSDDGLLVINGVKFDNALSKKIADLFFEGYDVSGYYNLIAKIAKNPESAVKSGLLDFIAANDLPITTDGNFLAYKVTNRDGTDMHSGRINYQKHMEEGKPVEMDREDVDNSRGVCSGRGLYFASIGYYGTGGVGSYYDENDSRARFLVEVDPADVVSIPTTYKNSKGRCCRMKVLRRIGWDPKNVPNNTAIIDVSKWEAIKPNEETKKANEKAANRTLEVTGTQRLVKKVSVEFLAALDKYIKSRHGAKVNPTLKNAQKATKEPNVTVSVGQIAEAAIELGYGVRELDEKPFGESVIVAQKKKK